jgi:HEAT repeat protein
MVREPGGRVSLTSMRLRDRLLGDPDRLDARGLRRALRHGGSTLRIGAAIGLARLGDVAALADVLEDEVPGVRRASARGLGWTGDPRWRDALVARTAAEPTDTVRAAAAGAALRCGAPPDDVIAAVRAAAWRTLGTYHGPRRVGPATGHGPSEAESAVWIEVGRATAGPPRARDKIVDDGLSALLADPHGPGAAGLLPALAAQAPAELRDRLRSLEERAGRRSEHAYLEALGWLGDPLVRPRLEGALTAMDSDPGRGFKHRRLAAMALGRLGDPAMMPVIEAALTREALEFEGRPGAGLGIQFPVRTVLLWALGEIGAPSACELLASYLDNTHGGATGGLHLPAMAALVKLGRPAIAAVEPLLSGPEVLAANAAGILVALGATAAIARAAADPRPAVRSAAAPAPVEGAHEADDSSLESDPRALEGLALLQDRAWFEAHEAIEDAWRPARGPRRQRLQGLIQGAVAFEHLRRGNPRGAWGQWTKARARLAPLGAWSGGVAVGEWVRAMDGFAERIELEARSASQVAGDGREFPALPPETDWPIPQLEPALDAAVRAIRGS